MTPFEKASKTVSVLINKYSLKYLDNRLDWSYFNCFQEVKPILSIDEIIEAYEDRDIFVIITYPDGHKKMILE